MAVIVMNGNVIKNKIIQVGEVLASETLLKLNMLLNTTLNGMSIEQINLGLIARLKEQAGIHSRVISDVLDAVAEIIHVDDDMEIYTSGATNIFKYPELSDKQSAQEIISAFEEKQQLADLVTETLASEENHGIQVYIGDVDPGQDNERLQRCNSNLRIGRRHERYDRYHRSQAYGLRTCHEDAENSAERVGCNLL